VPAGFYGVNVQQVFNGPSSDWQPDLSAMASGGLQVARIDARWQNVEPNPPSGGTHHYDWSMYDGIVQGLAEHGLRWLPIVAYSTTGPA
jgi:beta-glucosidase/6-phospho-beta-glucosidase/beta-galactosidase